ncbi:MAG: acyltransferase domain-containing protein, partial [Desulfomonile tiedjei]|nr:acyltransferase domain-containing protein [Desulfomonile tiedjei]
MSDNFDAPVIAFVWRPEEIKSSVVETARSTGARIIFDLSQADLNNVGIALLQADASNDVVDLKISSAALMDAGIFEFLEETGISRVWVEFQPCLLNKGTESFWQKIEELSGRFEIIPVLGDVDLIRQTLENHPQIRSLALKGSESSGYVSTETAFTLYSAVREITLGKDEAPSLFLWGGIALPEATAAFLATGAMGVVFESVHWLTDLVSIDAETRKKIANLRPDHTDLIGMSLGVPCRLFNKGNSKAVKELKDFAGSLCGAEIGEEQKRFFTDQVNDKSVHPLESKFARDELIPIGVEAAFADSFVRRFGSGTEEAFNNFLTAVDGCLSSARDKEKAFVNSPTAAEMGTRYPFIQGAMSWITDSPEFARRVADAGGLPTLALGMMEQRVLDEKLGNVAEIMGDKPYAVNVITLSENPHRDVQLQWIRQTRPRFAVIAAGEQSHAAELMKDGIEAIYIAPNEELLKMALDAGVRYVICEGHEAGGHVGQHSTLTLAQIVFDQKKRDPHLFKDRKIILAGGICNRETAFMAAMLGADAVQMGSAYLATSDIVETGALTDFYRRMILESEPGSTVITGEGTGLRIRSLRTPKIDAVCSLERDYAAGSENEASFRHKIEALSAGSLFVAARGMDRPGGSALGDDSLFEQGQFMSGACAGVLKKVLTVKEFHLELSESPLAEGLPVSGPIRRIPAARPSPAEIHEASARKTRSPEPSAYEHPNGERIAVTGMSVVNSLGNSPEAVWAACLAMKSGIVAVPPFRWDHQLFYHPRPRMPEKTYCKVGAFQNIQIDRKDIGVPPQDFRTMTDATKISMWLARNAIEESGILDSDIPRERIAVLISQNSGEAASTLQDVIIRGALTKIVSAMKQVVPMDAATEEAVSDAVRSGRIAIDDTTLLGRLNCSAGGFICNRYGFMGPSFSVSAACATALVALFSAVQMIRNGIIDAAVVGGGEEFLTPMHFLEFSALGALAGLSGTERLPWETSRPFDADRDGMVLGEGGGMIVIERESVAKKRGAAVHAYITSMGASNNHLGMVESSRITQEIAIRSSFTDTSYGPEGVDMIECHATSTRQGDVEEVQALKGFYNGEKRTVLTSFKSQIGHTLGASGINSLIRGIMAMNAGVFPPTLNCNNPDPDMGIEGSGITIFADPVQWTTPNGRPRRFQVNAFGFGGSNYVVQLEQSMDAKDTTMVSSDRHEKRIEADDQPALPDGISFYKAEIGGKNYRVSVVADTDDDAQGRIASTEPFTDCGPVAAKRLKALARQSIHIGQADMPTTPLAFVFPGQGSHYAGMSHELYQTFPIIREWMDRAAEVAEFDILQRMFFDNEEDLQKTRWQQPALFTMEYAMVQYLVSLGIRPTAMAGHSLGELTALCLAGVYSFEDGFRIVNKRAICMDKACSMHVDPGVMMAVDAPIEFIEDLLTQNEGIYITNFNSLHQIVLGGNTEKVKALGADLKAQGYRNTLLRVSMAFHSPIMECIHDELEEFIAGIEFHPPRLPVISNTTMKPFPPDTSEIKKIVMAHLESPVRWIQNVRTLWNDYNVRLFVEVGPRDILSNLIADTIEEAECLQTCLPSAEAMIYRTALAQLFARGHLPVRKPLQMAQFPKSCKSPEPVQMQTAPTVRPQASIQVSYAGPASTVASSLEGIVQREIGAFVLESFGRFLRPNI